jgi:hypothetical protein
MTSKDSLDEITRNPNPKLLYILIIIYGAFYNFIFLSYNSFPFQYLFNQDFFTIIYFLILTTAGIVILVLVPTLLLTSPFSISFIIKQALVNKKNKIDRKIRYFSYSLLIIIALLISYFILLKAILGINYKSIVMFILSLFILIVLGFYFYKSHIICENEDNNDKYFLDSFKKIFFKALIGFMIIGLFSAVFLNKIAYFPYRIFNMGFYKSNLIILKNNKPLILSLQYVGESTYFYTFSPYYNIKLKKFLKNIKSEKTIKSSKAYTAYIKKISLFNKKQVIGYDFIGVHILYSLGNYYVISNKFNNPSKIVEIPKSQVIV